MDRRAFFKSIVSAAVLSAGARAAGAATERRSGAALFFVPGYQADKGRLGGLPLTKHPTFTAALPRGYDGPVTLIARLDETDGSVKRALMPLKGHHVAIDPRGHQAFFSSLDGEQMVRFDPRTLAILDIVSPHAPGFRGGGHAAWTRGSHTLVMTERRPYARFTGSPADHRGRLVIRDGDTMKVIEVHESHGIAPHDIALIEDEGLIAVANYGSTWQTEPADDVNKPYRVVESRLSLIELASGRLVQEFAPRDNAYEVRHVAARDGAHVFGIGSNLLPERDVAPLLAHDGRVEPPDTYAAAGMDYGPAPLFAMRRPPAGPKSAALMPPDPLDFRQGQTLVYDPRHDEAIVTFASSHRLAVVDAKSFVIKRLIATDGFGLYFPRGIAFHPDGRRYVVSGSWSGLYFIARGSHQVDRAATWHEMFFHHSHITAAAAG